MRFTVWIANYGKNVHVRGFEDFARGLVSALRIIGQDVIYTPGRAPLPRPGRLLVLAAHTLGHGVELPQDAIIFNAEQVGTAPLPTEYLGLLQRHTVWDYSEENIRRLREVGVEAKLCQVGYVPEMTRPVLAGEEDIDVLHYGSINDRRKRILEEIADKGLRVECAFGVYGAERDALIARSKVVLNLHFYERPIFEIFRVSHLLANKKAVVSEGGGVDERLEGFAARSTLLVSTGKVADACRWLVDDHEARRRQAETGFEEFVKLDLVEQVRGALG